MKNVNKIFWLDQRFGLKSGKRWTTSFRLVQYINTLELDETSSQTSTYLCSHSADFQSKGLVRKKISRPMKNINKNFRLDQRFGLKSGKRWTTSFRLVQYVNTLELDETSSQTSTYLCSHSADFQSKGLVRKKISRPMKNVNKIFWLDQRFGLKSGERWTTSFRLVQYINTLELDETSSQTSTYLCSHSADFQSKGLVRKKISRPMKNINNIFWLDQRFGLKSGERWTTSFRLVQYVNTLELDETSSQTSTYLCSHSADFQSKGLVRKENFKANEKY